MNTGKVGESMASPLPAPAIEAPKGTGDFIPCPFFMERAPRLLEDKAKKLILYCESGECHRSICAADKAIGLGFTNVFVLKGGLPAWKEAGYDVEWEKRVPRVGISSVKPKALKRWLAEQSDPLLLDIRSNCASRRPDPGNDAGSVKRRKGHVAARDALGA